MSPARCVRSSGLLLLVPFLILAWASTALAQGTIIAGAGATVVVLPAPSKPANCGLIVAPPGSVVVVQQVQPAAQTAQPSTPPKAASAGRAVIALTRKEYQAKKDKDPAKSAQDQQGPAINWLAGTLDGYSEPLDLGNKVAVSKVVAILFDDAMDPAATVTYASGDGKKLFTRSWKPAKPTFKFKYKDDTTTYTYDAGKLKALFFIVPAVVPAQKSAQ